MAVVTLGPEADENSRTSQGSLSPNVAGNQAMKFHARFFPGREVKFLSPELLVRADQSKRQLTEWRPQSRRL